MSRTPSRRTPPITHHSSPITFSWPVRVYHEDTDSAGVVYYAVDGFHNLLGVTPDDPLRWIVPALYPAVAILGIVWALILKASKPDVYQAIGLGANSVTGVATQSRVLPSQSVGQHAAASQDVYSGR